jgi:hypothetical protein
MASHDLRPHAVPPPWRTLILVCSKCSAAKHGPDSGDIRHCLKKRLGKPHDLRVAEVECLKLCPDDGVALFRVDVDSRESTLSVVHSYAEVEALAEQLRKPG